MGKSLKHDTEYTEWQQKNCTFFMQWKRIEVEGKQQCEMWTLTNREKTPSDQVCSNR